MDWLGDVLGVVGSAVSGGLFGLIGTGFKAFMSYKDKKLTFEHERNMALDRAEARREEAKDAREMEGIRQAGESERSRDRVQQATYTHDRPLLGGQAVPDTFMGRWIIYPLFAFADWAARIIRPVITVGYGAMAIWFLFKMWEKTPDMFDGDTDAARTVLNMVVFVACSSATWWFGDRPRQRFNVDK